MLNRLLKQTSWLSALLLVSWLALHLGGCLMGPNTSVEMPMASSMGQTAMPMADHHTDCCDEQASVNTSCDQLGESLLQSAPQLTLLFVLLCFLPVVRLLASPPALHFWLCLYPLPIRSNRPPTRLRFCTWRD